MSQHLTTDQLERLRSGAVGSIEELNALDAHIAECNACRDSLYEKRVAARAFAIPVGDLTCLEFNDRARYVDGQLDAADREIVESHISICSQCAADVEALGEFAKEVRSVDWWRTRKLERWRSWIPSFGFAVAGAAAAAILLLTVVIAPMRNKLLLESNRVAAVETLRGNEVRQLAEANSRAAALGRQIADVQRENRQMALRASQLVTKLAVLSREGATGSRASTVVMALSDAGRPITVRQDGQVEGVAAGSPTLRAAIKTALDGGKLAIPERIASLAASGGQLMGASGHDAGPRLYGPISTAIRTEHPTFRWRPVPNAISYSVSVVDDENQSQAAVGAVGGGKHEIKWTVPDATLALKKGGVYRWYVVAIRSDGSTVQSPGKSSPPARFTVLRATELEQVKAEERVAGASHLARAVAYAAHGLLDEAVAQMMILAAENPASKPVRRILRGLERIRPISQDRQ